MRGLVSVGRGGFRALFAVGLRGFLLGVGVVLALALLTIAVRADELEVIYLGPGPPAAPELRP